MLSDNIEALFDTLQAENAPRHLPASGTAYMYSWNDVSRQDDWKADGYRWRNQGAAKRLQKYAHIGIQKTFYHASHYSRNNE